MEEIVRLPTQHLPLKGDTAQEKLRNLVDEADEELTVEYDGELFNVVCSRGQAKQMLQTDNVDCPHVRNARSVISHYAHSARPRLETWLDGIEQRLLRLLATNTRKTLSLTKSFIEPEAIRLTNLTFELDANQGMRQIHNAVISNSEKSLEDVIRLTLAREEGLAKDLSALPLDTQVLAIKMAYGVSIQPMSNICSLGLHQLWQQHIANEPPELNVASLWTTVCAKTGPVYPGLFRDSEGSLSFLIPTTWSNTNENFTFGYGARACPARSLVSHFFKGVLTSLKDVDLENCAFIPRNQVPFGISDVIITID